MIRYMASFEGGFTDVGGMEPFCSFTCNLSMYSAVRLLAIATRFLTSAPNDYQCETESNKINEH